MKSYKVTNFRLFGSEGAEIIFRPVTLFTGANSSGKSSLVKSIVVFQSFLQSLIDDYRRDGGYNPFFHTLDTSSSNKNLKLGGFSSVVNRSTKSARVSFTLTVQPRIALYTEYRITYSFISNPTKSLDDGKLVAISFYRGEDEVFFAEVNDKGNAELKRFNSNKILIDFLNFCRYSYIPFTMMEGHRSPESKEFDNCFGEEGRFSAQKAAQSEEGLELASLQRMDSASFESAHVAKAIVESIHNGNARQKYKYLFTKDLRPAIKTLLEKSLVFYFPILELFEGKSKAESIKIIREQARPSQSISSITYKEEESFNKEKESLISAFEASEYDSFVDYFISLEDFVLANVNHHAPGIGRWGESFNYIEDHILHKIDVSFDNNGFSIRKEAETMFSTAYSVLSNWQWAEEESKDVIWTKSNQNGQVSKLWGKDDDYILRSVDFIESPYYSSSHLLFEAFKDYLRLILNECLIPTDLSRLKYNTSALTTKVQRLYSFDEDGEFTNIIKNYLRNKAILESHRIHGLFLPGKEKEYIPDTFLNKWLGHDGLNICDGLEIDVPLGLGFSIRLKHSSYDELLADLGHGITQIVSTLIQIESVLIENEILEIERFKKQDYYSKTPTAIIAIEEPEASMHPSFQSRLAEVFKDAAERGVFLIIETHSEYLIRKIQYLVAKSGYDEKSVPFAVYYFSADGSYYDMGLDNDGLFKKGFGSGFFDESSNLKYDLLSLNEKED